MTLFGSFLADRYRKWSPWRIVNGFSLCATTAHRAAPSRSDQICSAIGEVQRYERGKPRNADIFGCATAPIKSSPTNNMRARYAA